MGYPPELFVKENLRDEYVCKICLAILQNPAMMISCGHVFCTTCINRWFERAPTCPACRSHGNTTRPAPLVLKNLLGGLDIFCRFRDQGCPRVGKLSSFGEYGWICDYHPMELKACTTCNVSMPQCLLPSHSCVDVLKDTVNELQERLRQDNFRRVIAGLDHQRDNFNHERANKQLQQQLRILRAEVILLKNERGHAEANHKARFENLFASNTRLTSENERLAREKKQIVLTYEVKLASARVEEREFSLRVGQGAAAPAAVEKNWFGAPAAPAGAWATTFGAPGAGATSATPQEAIPGISLGASRGGVITSIQTRPRRDELAVLRAYVSSQEEAKRWRDAYNLNIFSKTDSISAEMCSEIANIAGAEVYRFHCRNDRRPTSYWKNITRNTNEEIMANIKARLDEKHIMENSSRGMYCGTSGWHVHISETGECNYAFGAYFIVNLQIDDDVLIQIWKD